MNRSLIVAAVYVCWLKPFPRRLRQESDRPGQRWRPATGPTTFTVEPDLDPNNFKVDHPEQFPLATAGEHMPRRS